MPAPIENIAHLRARHGRAAGRDQVPRSVRGASQGRDRTRSRSKRAPSCSSTRSTRWSARAPPRAGRWTRATCSSRRSTRARCAASAPRPTRSSSRRSNGSRPGPALPEDRDRRAHQGRDRSDPAGAPSRLYEAPPQRDLHARRHRTRAVSLAHKHLRDRTPTRQRHRRDGRDRRGGHASATSIDSPLRKSRGRRRGRRRDEAAEVDIEKEPPKALEANNAEDKEPSSKSRCASPSARRRHCEAQDRQSRPDDPGSSEPRRPSAPMVRRSSTSPTWRRSSPGWPASRPSRSRPTTSSCSPRSRRGPVAGHLRPGRRGQVGGDPRDQARPRRPGPRRQADRLLPLRRPTGVGKTELAKSARAPAGHAVPALRHVRVHGEAQRQPSDRGPSRLRGLRPGRVAHRRGEQEPPQRGGARRDREGAPGHLLRSCCRSWTAPTLTDTTGARPTSATSS